jgi:hypothetical protein
MSNHKGLSFSCRCGSLAGHLHPGALRHGLRLTCHCNDCHAAERYHSRAHDREEPVRGVALYQTHPDFVHFDTRTEHLAVMRLGPNGLMRWYASCCGTPICNTLAKPTLPFVGVCVNTLDTPEALGKVKAEGFLPSRTPGGQPRHRGAARLVYGVFSRMITSLVTGRWRNTPFFDTDTRTPRADPMVLTKSERAALYD